MCANKISEVCTNEQIANDRVIVSIVVPAYNEQEVIALFHDRVAGVLDNLEFESEIIYVNDGSSDATLSVIEDLQHTDSRVVILDLSRNYGKEIALTAGLDHAKGDAVVVIDADLQDPPELIPEFIRYWQEGYDVVYGQRTRRDGETPLKTWSAHLFYRFMQRIGRVRIPRDTGDFRLLSRRAVEALGQLREQHRFMKGLFTWIGFPQRAVKYQRDPRYAGVTKWNYWALWNLAIEGVTSFTTTPLKIATYTGIFTALLAFCYGSVVIAKTIIFGDPVAGYPSLMVVVLFLGGVQLTALGIIGEYLGRMFVETKNRPLYFVNTYRPADLLQAEDNRTPASAPQRERVEERDVRGASVK